MINKAAEVAEIAQREYLAERLALCTDKQQAFFWKIFQSAPDGPNVSVDKLSSAIDLVERTIFKNTRDGRNSKLEEKADE